MKTIKDMPEQSRLREKLREKGANEVIEKRVVTIGLLDKSRVYPHEVFADDRWA